MSFFRSIFRRTITSSRHVFLERAMFHQTRVVAADSIETQPHPKRLVEHVFLRFDAHMGLFENNITISLPDTTPQYVVDGARNALSQGLKDRPDALDYNLKCLPEPEFIQNGDKWNRYMYHLSQREVEGAVDPYTLQAIVLDYMVNELNGTVVSSTSSYSMKNTETNTFVLSFPHMTDAFNYNGSYRRPSDTEYD